MINILSWDCISIYILSGGGADSLSLTLFILVELFFSTYSLRDPSQTAYFHPLSTTSTPSLLVLPSTSQNNVCFAIQIEKSFYRWDLQVVFSPSKTNVQYSAIFRLPIEFTNTLFLLLNNINALYSRNPTWW